MRRIFKLIRRNEKYRGIVAEKKADELLNRLLEEKKLKEIIAVHECSFLNKVLKVDRLVRRMDGKMVSIQVKSSPMPRDSVRFTEGMMEYFGEDWSHPLVLVLPPEIGWEDETNRTLAQINAWKGKFRYQDWQLEYSPYLDFSKFRIFGRSIKARAEALFEVRENPAKADEYKKQEAEFRQKFEELKKQRLKESQKKKDKEKKEEIKQVVVLPKISEEAETEPLIKGRMDLAKLKTTKIRKTYSSDDWLIFPTEEAALENRFEELRRAGAIKSYHIANPYSWAAMVWNTDVIVERTDGVNVPVSARTSRKIPEDESFMLHREFFLGKFGALPVIFGAETELEKINSWTGNFDYSGTWIMKRDFLFDPGMFKKLSFTQRIRRFLESNQIKYAIEGEILYVAGVKGGDTNRANVDKNGIRFLRRR